MTIDVGNTFSAVRKRVHMRKAANPYLQYEANGILGLVFSLKPASERWSVGTGVLASAERRENPFRLARVQEVFWSQGWCCWLALAAGQTLSRRRESK